MAKATTTLSAACAVVDTVITVASATSVAVGRVIICDGEQMQVTKGYVAASTSVPVLRGLGGTVTAAHVSGANVTHGAAEDFSNPAPGNSPVNWPNVRSRTLTSYSASGAITLPLAGSDAVAVINSTSTLTMTVAAPTKDLDGCILYIVANGKSASTVAFDATNGLGNAGSSYDVITFQNAGQVCMPVMACNGFWIAINAPITGTSTALSVAVS